MDEKPQACDQLQSRRLIDLGASAAEVAALLAYNQNVFDLAALGPDVPDVRFPLPDEPFVAFWETVVAEAREHGAYAALARHLPQLSFPIRAGISATPAYRAATRRGVPAATLPEATGLELDRVDAFSLQLYHSPAGRIPLLIARHRPDFVALVRALTMRNEPGPVPEAQGALMVSGYNNWARIAQLRQSWEALPEAAREHPTWSARFEQLRGRRELYQDRFILLSDGPYSAVPAHRLGLDEAAWQELSLVLRRDHECAHYLTRRLFGSMRNNVLDELIADFTGMVGATGSFRASWLLSFFGIGGGPRADRRLELYRGKPPLADGAFAILEKLIRAAAENLERFDGERPPGPRSPRETALTIAALATFRLDDLAAPGAADLLASKLAELAARVPDGG